MVVLVVCCFSGGLFIIIIIIIIVVIIITESSALEVPIASDVHSFFMFIYLLNNKYWNYIGSGDILLSNNDINNNDIF